jgi:hypothetical protein
MTAEKLSNLEAALDQTRKGHLPFTEFLQMFLKSDIAVPSAAEVMEDGSGFEPLLFPKEQVQMLACFTDKTRIGDFTSLTPYCLMMKGRELLLRIPSGYGLVVNPGTEIGFDISPDGIAKILKDFNV